ncbi:MAG TPA: TonB-dependent receptor, partial [Spongiibacteraceae bacterium]|nr:TonB-dependent receptor [Spongiibacteraceae bacterium]
FNINGFWTKYDNYQIQSRDTTSGTLPVIRTFAIGKVETKGVELSTSLQATTALRLDFNASYTKAEIKEYKNAPCYTGQQAAQGCVNSVQDLSGADMPEAPQWKYTAAADYTIFLPSLPFDANFGAFYRYQSKMHFDVFNDPNTEQNGYGVTNIYAGINSHDDLYRVQLFVNNVFDKHYYTNLYSDPVLYNFGGPVIISTLDRNAFRYAGIRFDAKFK